MIRLFLVILMAFVFNSNASAQIRFYRISNINITQEKYLFGDDEIRLTASGKRYDSYTIVANYTIYRTLKNVSIEDYRSYEQTYIGKNAKFPLQEYAKGQLLYSDGKVCEIVNKREHTLLKIKDVKLCAVYEDYSISQGLNWTNTQFESNMPLTGVNCLSGKPRIVASNIILENMKRILSLEAMAQKQLFPFWK